MSCPTPPKIRKVESNIQRPLVDNIPHDSGLKSDSTQQIRLDHKKKETVNVPKTDTWLSSYLRSGGKTSTPSIWQHKIPRLNRSQTLGFVKDLQLTKANVINENNLKIKEAREEAVTITKAKDDLEMETKHLTGNKETTKQTKKLSKSGTTRPTKQCSKVGPSVVNRYKSKTYNIRKNEYTNNSSNCDKVISGVSQNTNLSTTSLNKNITSKNKIETKISTPKPKMVTIPSTSLMNNKKGMQRSSVTNITYKQNATNDKVNNKIKSEISERSTRKCENIYQTNKTLQSQVGTLKKNLNLMSNLEVVKKDCDSKKLSKTINNNYDITGKDSKTIEPKEFGISKTCTEKQSTKNCMKIKLTINIICNNIEENINQDVNNIDLDFLNDFDVDEIVESLNNCENNQTPGNDSGNIDLVNGIDITRTCKKDEDDVLTILQSTEDTTGVFSRVNNIKLEENNSCYNKNNTTLTENVSCNVLVNPGTKGGGSTTNECQKQSKDVVNTLCVQSKHDYNKNNNNLFNTSEKYNIETNCNKKIFNEPKITEHTKSTEFISQSKDYDPLQQCNPPINLCVELAYSRDMNYKKTLKSSDINLHLVEKSHKLEQDIKIEDNNYQSMKVTSNKRTSKDKEALDNKGTKNIETSWDQSLLTAARNNKSVTLDKTADMQYLKNVLEHDKLWRQSENLQYPDNITASNPVGSIDHTLTQIEKFDNQSQKNDICHYDRKQQDTASVAIAISGLRPKETYEMSNIKGNKVQVENDRQNETVKDASEKVYTTIGKSDGEDQSKIKQCENNFNSTLNNVTNMLNDPSIHQEQKNKEFNCQTENCVSENLSENSEYHKTSVANQIDVTYVNSTKTISIDNTEIQRSGIFIAHLENTMFEHLQAKYLITTTIHEGKFSKIFTCEDPTGKKYAIKMSKYATYSVLKKTKNMWLDVQSNIPKDNLMIVKLLNNFSFGGSWCFLMDYYPYNLEQALDESERPYYIDHVQELARQLVGAVMHLRDKNIIHSDIKPTHILLSGCNKQLKLCGMDSACHIDNIVVLPNIGTVNYRAPEAILGFPSGFGLDVWSTGLVLFEMATKIKLFPGKYNNRIIYKQMCTLGCFPLDMIETSRYGTYHFTGSYFTKRFGRNGQSSYVIRDIPQNNKLRNCIHEAYTKYWSHERNETQRQEDNRKLGIFTNLLKKMLNVHPIYRLTIEFVYGNPFIYDTNI